MSGTPSIPCGLLSGSPVTEKPVSVVKCMTFSESQRYTEYPVSRSVTLSWSG